MWYRSAVAQTPSRVDLSEVTLEQLLDIIHGTHDLDPSMHDMESSKGEINLKSNPFSYNVGKAQIPNENGSSIKSVVNI